MSPTLLTADEETDTSLYGAYLRAQSDPDLLDISRHLDPERYPARCDAASRELRRRGLGHAPAYTDAEYFIRSLALVAFGLTVLTLALTFSLTPEEAAGPSWPTGEMLPDGIPVSEVMRLFGVALLRGVVVWSVHLAVYPLLLFLLGGWIVGKIGPLIRRRARADIWRLAVGGFLCLLVSLALAAGPHSAVPSLFHAPDAPSGWQRSLPLWNPFYET